MRTVPQGSFRLAQVAGIDLYFHWSWFLFAGYEISRRRSSYSSLTWNIAEYLGLFLIVLLHEFGHALACRQVGGQANQIVLWPLGGVAYVAPPPRPGMPTQQRPGGPEDVVRLRIDEERVDALAVRDLDDPLVEEQVADQPQDHGADDDEDDDRHDVRALVGLPLASQRMRFAP